MNIHMRTVWAGIVAAGLGLSSIGQNDCRAASATQLQLANGKSVEVGLPREVHVLDRIVSIEYRPGTHRITAVAHKAVNGTVKDSILLILGDTGEYDTLVTTTTGIAPPAQPGAQSPNALSDQDDWNADWQLISSSYATSGWSHDGRYLIAAFSRMDGSGMQFFRIDALKDPARLTEIDLPGFQLEPNEWSPDGSRFAFSATADIASGTVPSTENDKKSAIAVYDPETGGFTLVDTNQYRSLGWLDKDRLLMHTRSKKAKAYQAFDLRSHSMLALTDADVALMKTKVASPEICPTRSGLIAEIRETALQDAGEGSLDTPSVWLKAPGGKGHSSLIIAAGGSMRAESLPAFAWSDDGSQLAYLMAGHVYVVDIADHQPSPRERLFAGEDLPCPEMRLAAVDILKQIGLATLEFAEDNDEMLPSADHFHDALLPYIKDEKYFHAGSHPVIYTPPTSLALAKMDAPAETTIGRIDLDCGSVVLYADGHVRSAPNTTAR